MEMDKKLVKVLEQNVHELVGTPPTPLDNVVRSKRLRTGRVNPIRIGVFGGRVSSGGCGVSPPGLSLCL